MTSHATIRTTTTKAAHAGNATQHQMTTDKKIPARQIKKNGTHDQTEDNVAGIFSNFLGFKNTTSMNTRRNQVLKTQARQDRNQFVRQTALRMCWRSSTTKTHEHEHEDNYNQPQQTMTPLSMQELCNPINQRRRVKLQTREVSTRK